MNKVICDVCGTDYPETAAQCPICGCARSDGGQTSAGNAVPSDEERGTYTYVKGGRFSKSNVRKRLKSSDEPEVAAPVLSFDDGDDQEDDIPDDDQEPTSNRALIVIVILLLLAIIAVSSYIFIKYFGQGNQPDNDTTKNTGTSQSTPAPSGDSTPADPNAKPCTGLTLTQSEVILSNTTPYLIPVTVEPEDTTDKLVFESSDEKIATVDAKGNVTAVGEGEATITITCGSFTAECKVVSEVKTTVDPTDPTDPVDPTDPTDPVDPVVLKLNRQDFTLFFEGDSWNVYSGELDPKDITWTSDNENVAIVTNGKVVAVAPGNTTIRAEYEGQKASCKVYCRWEVEPENPEDPENPENPEDPENPENPENPTVLYDLRVNGNEPPFRINGKENTASVTIKIGESFSLSLVKVEDSAPVQDVQWTIANGEVCSMEGRKVSGLAKGKTTLTTTYEGQEFICEVFVTE